MQPLETNEISLALLDKNWCLDVHDLYHFLVEGSEAYEVNKDDKFDEFRQHYFSVLALHFRSYVVCHKAKNTAEVDDAPNQQRIEEQSLFQFWLWHRHYKGESKCYRPDYCEHRVKLNHENVVIKLWNFLITLTYLRSQCRK